MKMLECINSIHVLLVLLVIGMNFAEHYGDVKLQICTQQDDSKDEFLPLVHSPVNASPSMQSSVDGTLDVDVCVSENMVKINLTLEEGFDGEDITICWTTRTWAVSTPPTCYRISGLKRRTSNATMVCWFRQNVTEKNIVGFFISTGSLTDEKQFMYYRSVEIEDEDMCSESICERVEPRYGRTFYCGKTDQMMLPDDSRILQMSLTCITCRRNRHYKLEPIASNQTTGYRLVGLKFGSNLQAGTYNLTIWLTINEYGKDNTCAYRKPITILCEDGIDNTGSTTEAEAEPTSSESNAKHCEAYPEQCSFPHFVLFGVAVSSSFIVLICIVTCIVVRIKRMGKWSPCSKLAREPDVEGTHTPMIPNNIAAQNSPTSFHVPKHAYFHKMEDKFRLLFLPIPYDTFTRDSMECLRKVITLDKRIPSACVFDASETNRIFTNKFAWIDETLNDINTIVIFLCFTSLHKQRDTTIVDEVLRMCRAPATRPACQLILAHLTESTEVNFHGSSFNIMTEEGYKQFLETVFTHYGYKADCEHDKQKLNQILHCGASRYFLNQQNAFPTSLV